MRSLCGLTVTTDKNLLTDINCTNDGVTLGADNITLDCQGHTIEYAWNGSIGYRGVTTSGTPNNITIKNCVLKEGNTTGTAKQAIYLLGVTNSKITNNTIITKRSSSPGIYLVLGSDDNNITNNNINTTGTSSYGIHLTSGPDRNYIANNNITTNSMSAAGIYLTPSLADNEFINNTIKTSGGSGFYFNNVVITNYFYNNTITTTTTTGPAFYLYTQNQVIKDNKITSAAYGVYMTSNSANNNISGNKINTTGLGIDAFWMQDTSNNILTNNIINASGYSAHAFYLYRGSSNNIIANNTVAESGSYNINWDAYSGSYPENNTIENNNLGTTGEDHLSIESGVNGTILKNQEANAYSFNGNLLTIENKYGIIKYLTPVDASGNNLSQDIIISDNLISVNSSQTGLNASANITLYKVQGDWPTYTTRNNKQCPSNTCGTVTNESDTYHFNVTGFNESTYTNYSIHFNYCGQNITESLTLQNRINCTGTGLYIKASNIEINCQGYEINYTASGNKGHGINSTGNNNVTIKNCLFTEGKASVEEKPAIYLRNGYNSTIKNNVIETTDLSSHGVQLYNYSNSQIINNTITTKGEETAHTIYFYLTSENNTIVNNTLTVDNKAGQDSNGISIEKSNNNNIKNNTIKVNKFAGYGISLLRANKTIIIENKIITNYTDSVGLNIAISNNITVINNTINVTGNTSDVIVNTQSSSNLFQTNTIEEVTRNAFIVSSVSSKNITFKNNSLNNVGGYSLKISSAGLNNTHLINQKINNYSFKGSGSIITIENTNYGKITYLQLVNNSGSNLSQNIIISNNSIYVNSSQTGLNKSANLIFYNPGVTGDLRPFRNGQECPPLICGSLTNSSTTYYFNVTGFTNYSIGDITPSSELSGGSTSTTTTTTTTAPESSNEQTITKTVIKGERTEFKFEKEDLPIEKISFTATKDQELTIKAEKLDNKPEQIETPEKEVFSYLEIEGGTEIEGVEIQFSVEKDWMQENNIEEITLLRYTNSWQELPTQKIQELSDVIKYKATTPGFSYFAIAGKEKEEEKEAKELSMEVFLESEVILEKVRFKIILETPEIKEGTLEYSIITNTGTILLTEKEEIIIENKTLEKEIKLPENIAPVEYKLIIILKTEEETILKELSFNLGNIEQPTFFGTEKENYFIYFIISIILLLIILALFEIFPRKKPQ